MNYDDSVLTIEQYNDEIIPKATSYNDTNYVKSITAKAGAEEPPYYGIPQDSMITLSHLISVILYCDYTKLSSDFSSTFRKCDSFETLQSIKQRNRKYFWMSRLLRETVEIFGQRSQGDYDLTEAEYKNKLFGPFYSGLSVVISIPNFFIRLYSPTSTSKHIQVALKFSGDNGIIMKLDNPIDNAQCSRLRAFDCTFISRYKEEAERYIF